MVEPAKRLTPVQRAFLLGLCRAKARRSAEQRAIEDRLEDLQEEGGSEEVLAAGVEDDD
jgi:hypothetical protein